MPLRAFSEMPDRVPSPRCTVLPWLGPVDQRAEHSALSRQVVGSIPTASTNQSIAPARLTRASSNAWIAFELGVGWAEIVANSGLGEVAAT